MSTRNKPNNETPNPENPNPEVNASGAPISPYLAAAARLPSSYPLGAGRLDNATIGLSTAVANVTPTYVSNQLLDPVPGFLILDYIPTLGVSESVTSPLNRAMYNEFNAIRSQISGNRSYEPADHMLYRICVDSLRELYLYVQRIYGIVRVYTATNLYRPDAALSAMGLDAQDWKNNAARLYQWLLNNKEALAPFPTVPMGEITTRRVLYNSAIYTDGVGPSVQGYIINQKYFYSYEVVDQVKGVTPRSFPATFDEFTQMWDTMYAALMRSSDVYTIAADIRRAFGDRVITGLPDTNVDHAVSYIKLDPVLRSIMNTTIVPDNSPDFVQFFRITDVPGNGLHCAPRGIVYEAEDERYLPYSFQHLNMVEPEPGPGEIVDAVRFKPAIKVVFTNSTQNFTCDVESMGTEVFVGAKIVSKNVVTGLQTYDALCNYMLYTDNGQTAVERVKTSYMQAVAAVAALSNFDWHFPVVVATIYTAGQLTFQTSAAVFEDVQNYVPINNAQLKMLHEAVILNEFGV